MQWYECDGPECDVVLDTCVEIVRNPEGMAFPTENDPAADELYRKIIDRLVPIGFSEIGSDRGNEASREALTESFYLPAPTAGTRSPHHVLLNEPCHIAVLLGGEDHVTIRGLSAGLSPTQTHGGVLCVAKELEAVMEPAFSPTLGYLTHDPARVGSGCRVSIDLLLPTLDLTGRLPALTRRLADLGLCIGPLPFPATPPHAEGSLRIGNRFLPGNGEAGTLHLVGAAAKQLVLRERQAREAKPFSGEIRDRILRARGILQNAGSLGADEAFGLLTSLRLGLLTGIIEKKAEDAEKQLTALLVTILPSTLSGRLLGRQKDPSFDGIHRVWDSPALCTARAGEVRRVLGAILSA